jgi:hypothetical protein
MNDVARVATEAAISRQKMFRPLTGVVARVKITILQISNDQLNTVVFRKVFTWLVSRKDVFCAKVCDV